MKKVTTILFVLSAGIMLCQPPATKFEEVMYKKLQILDTSKVRGTLENLFEDFQRVAIIEKKQWMPFYYMAYCKIRLAGGEGKEMADETLDEAKRYLNIADSLSKNNTEVLALKSRVALSKIPLGNPIERAPKYAALAKMYAESAIEKDPKNPRAYLVMAMYYSFLPTIIGGDAKKACENLRSSKLYYKGKKRVEKDLNTYWGEVLVDDMLVNCK